MSIILSKKSKVKHHHKLATSTKVPKNYADPSNTVDDNNNNNLIKIL